MKKTGKRFLVLLLVVFSLFAFAAPVSAKSKKVKAPGKVKASSIQLVKSTRDKYGYECIVFKWKKVKGASGYQIRIIDSERYEYDDVAHIYTRDSTKKNKITTDAPLSSQMISSGIRLQVRAYKSYNKGKSKKYGKWVTSSDGWFWFPDN